ncbi:MAG: sigma-54 dependent transcriptional regulator [Pseudomonadota bacterium]
MTRTILVIDDNEGVRTALSVLFSVHDLPCVTADGIEAGLAMLDHHDVGLVVQDMNFTEDTTSGKEGEALFHELRRRDPDLPVILLTAWTHLETAVTLVRAGAADYLSKPWDDEKLLATARNLLELGEATARIRDVDQSRAREVRRLQDNYDLRGTVFASPAMQALIAIAVKVAPADVPVLITGPNGAGKERIADIIHYNSAVKAGPFVKVNVGALPDQLIESELFGAEAGAYTGATRARVGHFERANGGTLFLDEIGNLNLDGQAKLLRVLQTGEFQRLGSSSTRSVNVRVISATNADLAEDVAGGRFREDIYYRLNVIELEMAPLNQRRDDILPLAYHFLGDDRALEADAEAALLGHDWSGNVRELENTIRRASLLASDTAISRSDLALPAQSQATSESTVGSSHSAPADREAIENALQRAGGIVAKAARELGLSRQALYRRMDKFGIEKP